ncbi:hypothetical protein PFICI_09991 [Pestalotiopsis fici W106-1]|uniref:Uncharacterized protein n=1 Tax=Pestalotiopsis fici (strain W106-1 / CGMCC3.15140) TaxID=1229662 RepID=W3WVT3_PESFW|nr:uncharacterized protein PFICI_09991 [Pestalotiopsis fici W106-1]ETS77929.1 hypothetical protein PFICI_09991 [Pestalotiopsis fici W106-1]
MPAHHSIIEMLKRLYVTRARQVLLFQETKSSIAAPTVRSFRALVHETYQPQQISNGPSPSPNLSAPQEELGEIVREEFEEIPGDEREQEWQENAELLQAPIEQDNDLCPRPSPSTFDRDCQVLVLATDGCSIPINHRHLPLYANIVNPMDGWGCTCGGDAYVVVAALLRAWPNFAMRVWGGPLDIHRERILFERDEAVLAWSEPAQDTVRRLLDTAGHINRGLSDAVQEALRREAQKMMGVNEVTVNTWAREDQEFIELVEEELKRRAGGTGIMGIFNPFTSMR